MKKRTDLSLVESLAKILAEIKNRDSFKGGNIPTDKDVDELFRMAKLSRDMICSDTYRRFSSVVFPYEFWATPEGEDDLILVRPSGGDVFKALEHEPSERARPLRDLVDLEKIHIVLPVGISGVIGCDKLGFRINKSLGYEFDYKSKKMTIYSKFLKALPDIFNQLGDYL